ncbi:SsrA-binding protein SmpB [soil metagenome]
MKKSNEKHKGEPKRVDNRRARYDYAFDDTFEAGMVLFGSEVKSLYHGKANLTDSYCQIKNNELWVLNVDIEPYDKATVFQHERRRERKLLMHRKEIDVLHRKSQEKGFSIIPMAMYFKNGKAKLQVGLGRGKANYDKRDSIAKAETKREQDRIRAGKYQ